MIRANRWPQQRQLNGEYFMQKIALSTELVNAILQYLGNQPFVHVTQLINGIQQEAQAQAAPAAPTEAPAAE
jgi:hypothetical protein